MHDMTAMAARRESRLAALWRVVWNVIGRSHPKPLRESDRPFAWGPLALILLIESILLFVVAYAQGLGRIGDPGAARLFWPSVFALILPGAFWATRPTLDRRERLLALLLVGEALYALKIVYAPLGFPFFDEFLHWRTSLDILELRKLFVANPMLPVSPLYPGLELTVDAVAKMTGLNLFATAMLLVALWRALSVTALFLAFERVAGSARTAAFAVAIFMSNSGFVSFHGQYAYETLAFVFFLFICMLVLRLESDQAGDARRDTALALFIAPALAVTHHLTSYMTAGVAGLAALAYLLRPAPRRALAPALLVALAAFLLPIAWAKLISAPTADYIGSTVVGAMNDLGRLLSGEGKGRRLFVSSDGVAAPILLQVAGAASVLAIAVGLTFGFFRTLTFRPPRMAVGASRFRPWRSSGAAALGLLGAAFPITVLFRLTGAGWEIGNRLNPFLSVGAAFVSAVAITHFFQARRRGLVSQTLAGLVLAVCIFGGMVNGWGVAALRGPYRVEADSQSIEPAGIEAARWTREALGENNRFVADRVNNILLLTYGRQHLLSTLYGDPSTALLLYNPTFGPEERNAVKTGAVDYLLVDLRLSSDLPKLGHYFEPGDLDQYGAPPKHRNLLKFDSVAGVDRILDASPLVVFDLHGLRNPVAVSSTAIARGRPPLAQSGASGVATREGAP